ADASASYEFGRNVWGGGVCVCPWYTLNTSTRPRARGHSSGCWNRRTKSIVPGPGQNQMRSAAGATLTAGDRHTIADATATIPRMASDFMGSLLEYRSGSATTGRKTTSSKADDEAGDGRSRTIRLAAKRVLNWFSSSA